MISNKTLAFCIGFAAKAHSQQFDKKGNPYILHPIAVMEKVKVLVREWEVREGCSLDINLALSVACMHDVFEDVEESFKNFFVEGVTSGIDFDEIMELANQVGWLTHQNGISYDSYIDAMIADARVETQLVKMADMEHNSDMKRCVGAEQKDIDRIAKYMRNYLKIKNTLNL